MSIYIFFEDRSYGIQKIINYSKLNFIPPQQFLLFTAAAAADRVHPWFNMSSGTPSISSHKRLVIFEL